MEIPTKTSQTQWSLAEGTPIPGSPGPVETDKPANLGGVTEPVKGEIKDIGIPAMSQTTHSDPAGD